MGKGDIILMNNFYSGINTDLKTLIDKNLKKYREYGEYIPYNLYKSVVSIDNIDKYFYIYLNSFKNNILTNTYDDTIYIGGYIDLMEGLWDGIRIGRDDYKLLLEICIREIREVLLKNNFIFIYLYESNISDYLSEHLGDVCVFENCLNKSILFNKVMRCLEKTRT